MIVLSTKTGIQVGTATTRHPAPAPLAAYHHSTPVRPRSSLASLVRGGGCGCARARALRADPQQTGPAESRSPLPNDGSTTHAVWLTNRHSHLGG